MVKKAQEVNATLDRTIRKMLSRAEKSLKEGASLDKISLDAIKLGILWEKVKNAIKGESDYGEFFRKLDTQTEDEIDPLLEEDETHAPD